MSDKNPSYSISATFGQHTELVEMLPPSNPDLSVLAKMRERIERQIAETFGMSQWRPTALAYRGGQFVSLPIDDNGNVVEPPPRCPYCGPILWCLKHGVLT